MKGLRKNLMLGAATIVMGYFAYDGLATGEVMRDAGSWLSRRVTRDGNPVEYWLEITTLLLLSFSFLCMLIVDWRSED
jgi:hypothetical protein